MEFVSKAPLSDEQAVNYALLGQIDEERGRRLFTTGAILLALALGWLYYTASTTDPLHLVLGLVIFTLSMMPGLLWARSGGGRFPVFETIMILCANTYALPMISGHGELSYYVPEDITKAGVVVVVYQLSALICYTVTGGLPGRSAFWKGSLINQQVERLMIYGLSLSSAYIWVSTFTTWVPPDLLSPLRAVFYGIGIICTFVGMQRWGRGELTTNEKTVFFCNLCLQLFLMSVGLVLIGAISLMGIALLGYISGGKRIPWLVIILLFITVGILHAGKSQMREKYWAGALGLPSTTELPAYFSEWVGYGLARQSSAEESTSRKLLERTSLMHMLCLIVSYTPERQDYLHGRSYGHVLPQLIPRFFWAEKPRSHVATYELAIYYGLQQEESTTTTTIAFGLVAEAYANFGLWGAFLLGAFWGCVLKKLQVWSTFSPMFSLAGLLMILLTAWAFSAELTMAAWVSSFQQAIIVVLGVPWVIRNVFGD